MKERKFDIGIFWYTMGDNYGGITTYYALYKYLETLGKSVCIIPPLGDRNWNRHSVDFFETHCQCLKKLKGVDYNQYNRYVDTFVLGSDQLWGDIFLRWKDHVYLGFVEPGHKKIAYGVSYGNNYPAFIDNDPTLLLRYSKLVSDIDYLSHRENDGCQITKKWFRRNDTVNVVDPVFLVDNDIWDGLIDEIDYDIPDDNLTFYMIEPSLSHLRDFHNISRGLGVKDTLFCTNNAKKLSVKMDKPTTRLH